MFFKEDYGNKIRTMAAIIEINPKLAVRNEIIDNLSIKVFGHFRNMVTLEMQGKACRIIAPDVGYTDNLGYILRFLVDLFDVGDDGNTNIEELIHTPLRVIIDTSDFSEKVIAFGHFMKDEFIYIKDLFDLGRKK